MYPQIEAIYQRRATFARTIKRLAPGEGWRLNWMPPAAERDAQFVETMFACIWQCAWADPVPCVTQWMAGHD
jgi:hypothetical protein